MSLFFLGSFELEFLLLFWGLILPQIEVRLGSSSPVGLVNLFWSKTRVHSGPLPMRSFLVCRMYFRVASFFGFFCSFVFSLCSLSSTLSAVVVVCYSVFFWWVFSSFSVPSSACWWTGEARNRKTTISLRPFSLNCDLDTLEIFFCFQVVLFIAAL